MNKIIIIGAGVSGLSVGLMLTEAGKQVTIFEKEKKPGGLVRCDVVQGALYHRVGGHVFNSRNKQVLEWFWKHFSKDAFQLATRHAVISLQEGVCVDYPIENHLYELSDEMRSAALDDFLALTAQPPGEPDNFDDFLRRRFGNTLYNAYFGPYNRKIWRRPLTDVPLQWLQGKLPMPTIKEILSANIAQVKEMQMVHSTFWYPRCGGSQYIADRLASGLDVRYGTPICEIQRTEWNTWVVNGQEAETVIFCGNVKDLPRVLQGRGIDFSGIDRLEAHGTTSVLCSIETNPYSWVYLPSEEYEAHRMIVTGNFAASNNPPGITTATIEFSSDMAQDEIERQLQRMPYAPRYITHHYTPYTYPMQQQDTRGIINALKSSLEPQNFYLLGRFAEWEYYNMDAAMEAAMNLTTRLTSSVRGSVGL